MGHRKWEANTTQDHNALYDAWEVERDRAGDLLKDRNAIQGKLDEARKRITELETRPALTWEQCKAKIDAIEETQDAKMWGDRGRDYRVFADWLKSRLPAPTDSIRVPFSDAQIERMARAAHNEWHEEPSDAEWNAESRRKQLEWCRVVRAALAAGGLEPCAVPDYDPDDVALVPSDTPIIADLHKQLESARREVDEVRRHISVTMSREHQARKEAQQAKRELAAMTEERDHKDKGWNHSIKQWEKALGELNEAKKSLAAESEWVRIYKQDRDDALAELAERASVDARAALEGE